MTVARASVCTNLTDGVVPGEVKAVSVSGLSDTSSQLHLLLLIIQHSLRDKLSPTNLFYCLVRLSFGTKKNTSDFNEPQNHVNLTSVLLLLKQDLRIQSVCRSHTCRSSIMMTYSTS